MVRRSANAAEVLESASVLYSIWRLPDGSLAVLHQDHRVLDYQNFILASSTYVSLLSPDLSRACVDYLLLETEDRPRFAWRGDTLFAAFHEVTDDEASLRLQGFGIDSSGCDWQPT